MAALIYSGITSLDGYIEDAAGNFDWAEPDAEVHAFVNDRERGIGTYLFGRRMYETMLYWETADALPDQHDIERDFTAIWKAADKIVFSTTLEAPSSARTTIERTFDPETIRTLKASSARDLAVGGAVLGAEALRAGLVDEIHQFVNPVIVGGGKRFLPDDVFLELELLDERRFAGGVVFLRYGLRR